MDVLRGIARENGTGGGVVRGKTDEEDGDQPSGGGYPLGSDGKRTGFIISRMTDPA